MSEEFSSLGAANTSGMACDKEIHLDATRPKRSEGVTVKILATSPSAVCLDI